MGRGRAKAKQTKVARELKYQSFQTDFGALARELHGDDAGHGENGQDGDAEGTDVDEYDDGYDKWADRTEPRD